MAPWNSSSNTSSSDTASYRDNAAIRFRHFADEKINVLLDGFKTLPGMHAAADNAKARSQLQDWEKEMRSAREKMNAEFPDLWNQLLESPARKPGQGNVAVTEDARQAARALLLQARNANVGLTNPDKILDLYQDHGESMLPVTGPVPIRASGTGGWLGIDWFRKNPYSPIQLEQHEQAHKHGSMWRAAFEDLLAATLDKKQTAREVWEGVTESESTYKGWGAPGMDWMLGLQCRGLLPPQLPSLYNISPAEKKKLDRVFGKIIAGSMLWTPYGKVVKRDFEQLARVIASPELDDVAVKAATQPETELDMYEHFMEGPLSKEEEQPDEQETTDKNMAGKMPSVVATLTTTETTTLPDGTSQTRRTLKKRFADGREDIEEEVSCTSQNGDGAVDTENAGKKDKGGWFWT
ncbi:hypothetical protein BDV97DRAFT_39358 [Delphinella strobiligena]|nr:hypothetical protein BDV97DRAFT_39358 [Delphinella strobiligena]